MADNIKIGVEVNDGGSSGQTAKNVKNVKDVLDQTTVSASKATKAVSALSAAQATAGAATKAKIKQATGGGGGEDERGMYAAQRGAVGTGAAGRDFSKEAQGLGGVVRLYATFAANIYAVGAAFNALSSAMDTANMVKGLDQLGAAQGRNLGSLAKQLTVVTDGALSLRESLTAVAQTSASGMTNANILKLGEVAKKASQALGVNLPDAVNRLSRGITKLEPELLDELGIFTKIDKATEDYARTIGKSAGALTDFERRQAFANAVLDEGNKKFSEINIDVNPYTQLAASFKNAVDSGLNLVNKVLTPIVSLLASNPTALVAVLGTIGAALLKQALPALGAFKSNLDKTTIMAADNAKALAKKAEDASLVELARAKKIATEKADFEFNKNEEALARIDKLKKAASTEGIGLKSRAILEKIPQSITDEDFKQLEKTEQKLRNFKEASKTAAADALKEGIATARKSKESIALEAAAVEKYQKQELENSKLLSNVNLQKKIARDAEISATGLLIRQRAAENSQVLGLAASYKLLKLEIQAAQAAGSIDKTGAAWTRFSGTIGLVASKIGNVVQAFGRAVPILGAIVAVIELADTLATSSAKQAKAFSSSVDTLDSSLENVRKTVEAIYRKPLAEAFSIEAIQARANALVDLSQSVEDMASAFDKLIKSQNAWDRGWDALKDFFGMSAGDKLAAGLADSVVSGLKLIREGPAKETAKKAFQDILGPDVDITSIKSIDNAIDSLTDPEQAAKARLLAAEIKNLSKVQANQASSLTTLKSGFEETGKLVDTFNNSLKATDNFSKMGNQLLVNYRDLSVALGDSTNNLAAMNELVNNTKLISLLPPEAQQQIIGLKKEVGDLFSTIGIEESNLSKTTDELNKSNSELAENLKQVIGSNEKGLLAEREALKYANDRLKLEKSASQERLTSLQSTKQLLEFKFKEINSTIFDSALKKLELGLKGAFAEAGIIAARGYVSLIQAAGGNTAALENKLQQQEINIQIQNIEALYQNSRSLKELTTQLAIAAANEAKKDLEKKGEQINELTGQPIGLNKEDTEALNKLKNETIPKLQSMADFYKSPSRGALTSMKKAGGTQAIAAEEIGASGFTSELYGREGAIAKLKAQLKNLNLAKDIIDPQREIARLGAIDLDNKEAAISRSIEDLRVRQSVLGIYSEELASRQNTLELSKLENRYEKEKLKITEQRTIAELTLARQDIPKDIREDVRAEATKALTEAQSRQQQLELKYAGEVAKAQQAQEISKLDAVEKQRQVEVTRQNTLLGFIRQEAEARLGLREQELNSLNARGLVSETYLINANAEIALKRQEIQLAQELKVIEDNRIATQIDYENRIKKTPTVISDLGIETTDPAAVTVLEQEKTAKLSALEAEKAGVLKVNELKTKGNEITKLAQLETAANNKRLEEQAVALERIQGIAQTLGTVFGEFGKSLGAGLESILKATQDFTNKRIDLDKKYSKDKTDLEQTTAENIKGILADPMLTGEQSSALALDIKDDAKKRELKLEKDYNKKSVGLELDRNISVVSAAKNMFKEKTAAYKIFGAFEKAMAMAKLALDAKQIVMEGLKTVEAVAGSMTRIAADELEMAMLGGVAIMEQGKGDPYTALARMAAMAAFVAALLSSFGAGGKSVSVPGGSTAEERQEVQSTGQKYVDGKLVETGLGVLGDPTAELETIANGIDRLEKHSIGSLDLSNGMLDALKAIRENTGSFVTALVRTNITKQDPGSSGGNWLFGKSSTENIDKLLSISGTLQEVIEQTADINQIVVNKVSSSGFLGFGGDTSVQRVVQKFEPEQQGEIERSISLLFTSFADTVEAGATALNLQLQPSWKALYSLPDDFETSLLNMSYEDVGKALEAGLGQVLGDFVRNTYPQLTKFQAAGEDLGSMFIRLGSDSQSLKAAFATVGTNLQTFTETTTTISTAAQRANTDSLRLEKERIEGLIAAQTLVRDAASGDEYEAARNTIYYLGLELATATTAYNNSLRLYNSGLNVSTTLNIEAEQRIIKANGGMDSFIERIKDFSKEILTAGDRTEIAGKSYGDFITGLVTTARTANTAARTALENVPSQPNTVGPGGTITTLGGYTMTRDVFGDIAAWQANGGVTRTAAEGNVAQTSEALTFAERLSSVKTRQEFKELYRSIDQSTDSGAKFAAVMLKIAPQFAEITDALEKYNTALEDQKVKMGALGIAGGLTPDQAKSLERDRQRIKISEEYTTVQAAELIANQNAIWQAEDRLDITKREIALLSEQGYTYSALLENRKLELSLMTEEQKILQTRLYAIQDQNKTDALNVRLMEASGDATGALYARRVLELRSMSELDQEILRRIWLLEDEKKTTSDTTNLAIELMEAEGDTIGALNARRTQELKGLSLVAQEMKIRIWTLQDEKKVLTAKNAQEIKIYEALGNASEALRLQREAELESMDAALRPGQRYLYALQDQKTIYDKLKSSISNVTSSLKASIQTLKDYQFSLKTGDKTILKPAEVYALKKQEFFNLKAIAEAVATTPAEEAAQATAISKLPAAADAFLESSRTLFASGQAYTDDFNLIDSALTSLSGILNSQLSDAEKNLKELTTANGFLDSIDDSTKTTAELMAELVAANANVAITRAAASAAGYTAAGGSASDFNTGTSGGIPGVQPVTSTGSGGAIPDIQQTLTLDKQKVLFWYQDHQDITDRNPRDDIDPATGINALDYWAQNIARYGLGPTKLEFAKAVARDYGKSVLDVNDFGLVNEYARGGLASGLSIVGEEGPELVDFQTPGRVYPAGQTTAMLANNTALVEEIKALRQEVEKLRNEQKEQTGHLITTNYDANRIAAEMLAKVTEESSKEAAWANRSAAKVV